VLGVGVVGAQHGRPRDLDQATRHKPDPVLQHGISSSSQYYGLRATTQPNPALLTNYKPRRSKNYFHRDLPHPLHCTCSASTPRGGLGRLPIRGQSRQGDQVVVKLHGHLARLQHGSPKFQIPCFLVYRFSRILLCNFHIPSYSKFPGPLRGSAEGPQTPDSMFPSVQIPGNSSENSTFRVSEFPRHLRCGSAEGPQIPVSKFPSVQIPLSRILLCKKFHIPSFRVSEAGGPLLRLGSEPEGPTNSRFRVWSFRVYGAHSWVRAGWTVPKAKTQIANIPQIPSCSERNTPT
jgi:hypothetical protein